MGSACFTCKCVGLCDDDCGDNTGVVATLHYVYYHIELQRCLQLDRCTYSLTLKHMGRFTCTCPEDLVLVQGVKDNEILMPCSSRH